MAAPSPARTAALKALVRVEQDRAYAPLALSAALGPSLSRRDRALATELVYGTLRWQGQIDYYLQAFSHRPLDKLSAWSRAALRLAVYQALFMDSVPLPVAASESVLLVKEREPWAAGYVNGVLRAFSRGWQEVAFPDPGENPAAYLAAAASHPQWLVARWLSRWGFERTEQICRSNNRAAPVTVRVNGTVTGVDSLKEAFARARIPVERGRLSPSALRLQRTGAVQGLPGFEAGHFQVQDESSQLVAWVVDPHPGHRVADLCAGPGGKSTHLAELLALRGAGPQDPPVTAVELHPHKARLIEESAARLGLSERIRTLAADARELGPQHGVFDRVLVDVPCSGTGVLRRRPDLRWQRGAEDLPALVKLQRELLRAAARVTAPGGVLVYSTCSLEPEENREVFEWFLREFPEFEPSPIQGFLPEPARSRLSAAGPVLEILPDEFETDGFFIFRAARRAS